MQSAGKLLLITRGARQSTIFFILKFIDIHSSSGEESLYCCCTCVEVISEWLPWSIVSPRPRWGRQIFIDLGAARATDRAPLTAALLPHFTAPAAVDFRPHLFLLALPALPLEDVPEVPGHHTR